MSKKPSFPPPPDDLRPRRPIDEPPGLMERAGCFTFVALPLFFGTPVMYAWSTILGQWFLWAYIIVGIGILMYIVYLLERKEEE